MMAPIFERLTRHVAFEPNTGCWLWYGAACKQGYGRTCVGSKRLGTYRHALAHRAMYEALRGPIPLGLEIDHLCRQPACINPDHLEPVTRRENVMRGLAPILTAKIHGDQTHCHRGHPFDEQNTYRRKHRKGRLCRKCDALNHQRYRREAGSAA